MKRFTFVFAAAILMFALAACGQSKPKEEGAVSSLPAQTGSAGDAGKQEDTDARIDFNTADKDKTYKEHVSDLWENTKKLLRDDLNADFSDKEYQDIGNDIEAVWSELQVHSSLDHKDETEEAAKDITYANLVGDIKGLVNKEYGNWGTGSADERAEKRESLRDGGLERKITEFDKIVYGKV